VGSCKEDEERVTGGEFDQSRFYECVYISHWNSVVQLIYANKNTLELEQFQFLPHIVAAVAMKTHC
jgi:hypothetical protein